MLQALGMPSIDALTDAAVPSIIRSERPLDLGPARGEHELLEELAARTRARQLRRVSARIFVLFPSPSSAWGWVASLVRT